MDVVLIPCFSRPEFLEICLEQIAKNDCDDLLFLFHIDFDYNPLMLGVINKFPYNKMSIYNPRHGYKRKLPVNILEGYRKAFDLSDNLVFMIEEDMIISDDFFKWHREIHKDGDFFCSIASKNNNLNRDLVFDTDLNKYYTSHFTYQSLGVCFNKDVLEKYVFPHSYKRYYRNNEKYCLEAFPQSKLGMKWCEQAGLIRRIQEKISMPIAYPHTPRAYHAGFYGKNRNGRSFSVQKLREICFDHTLMKQYALNENYYIDSMPINLKNDSWDGVQKTIHYAN